MRPLRVWAKVGGVKLLGACAGPPHLSDEPLHAVAPLDLRCRSRGEAPKDEIEEDDESTQSSPPTVGPTTKPKQKVKCPADCDCDVSDLQYQLLFKKDLGLYVQMIYTLISHSGWILPRSKPSTPHVRVGVTPKCLEVSPPRRSCSTSAATTFTTFPPTASRARARSFLCTWSSAKSGKSKPAPFGD